MAPPAWNVEARCSSKGPPAPSLVSWSTAQSSAALGHEAMRHPDKMVPTVSRPGFIEGVPSAGTCGFASEVCPGCLAAGRRRAPGTVCRPSRVRLPASEERSSKAQQSEVERSRLGFGLWPLFQAAEAKGCSFESKPQFRVLTPATEDIYLGRGQQRRLAGEPSFCPDSQRSFPTLEPLRTAPLKLFTDRDRHGCEQGSGFFPPKGEPVSPAGRGSASTPRKFSLN